MTIIYDEYNQDIPLIKGFIAVASFIGFTEDIRDDAAELFKPTLVTSWINYLQLFAKPNSNGFTDFNAYLPFAVYGYFLNGGTSCWITSIGTELPTNVSPNRFAQEVEGDRNQGTGLRGILKIDEWMAAFPYLTHIRQIHEGISMVAFPDLMRVYEAGVLNLEQVYIIMEQMISLCDGTLDGNISNHPNRMVLFDPPSDCVEPQKVAQWLEEFGRRSMFAALYYPWIEVSNPRNAARPILVPPCGHMMGVWARIDRTVGVHKPPANVVPEGVIGLAYDVSYHEQERLNSLGINCICKVPDQSIRILGARTLVKPDLTEWRYISVRRLVSYIKKSIEIGIRWAVFEPNDDQLWKKVRLSINNFLERLWQEGALVGANPQEAFRTKCDEENNPPETMHLCCVYIDVEIAPVQSDEFVVFRIIIQDSSLLNF